MKASTARRLTSQLEKTVVEFVAGKQCTVPEAGKLYWDIFIELSGHRSFGTMGANPLTLNDIVNWASIRRWPFRQIDLDILLAMDSTLIQEIHKSRELNRPTASLEAVDAMFEAAGWS